MSGDAPTPAHDPAAEGLEASVPLESGASMNSDEGQPSGQSAPLADNEARLQQLEQEHSSLREEHETLRSQYMRIAADFDNFRKRQSRDQDDLRLQLICTTLSEILPVVDNFERARQQLEPQGEEAQALHRSYQGLYKQLVEVLKQLGVASMRVVGQAFDPTLHEAVSREPSEEHPEDVVTEELQRGYHLNGRVLRHALVKVSMGPGPQSGASPSSAQSNDDSTATFQGEADPVQPGV
ncbi:MAG: nucleotide exchange factor GrpE [Prochlorococcus sp. MED-G132]|nr:MAG: nucleotide exchange factor GrpE [Prochlorococcus sp. MED-G132]